MMLRKALLFTTEVQRHGDAKERRARMRNRREVSPRTLGEPESREAFGARALRSGAHEHRRLPRYDRVFMGPGYRADARFRDDNGTLVDRTDAVGPGNDPRECGREQCREKGEQEGKNK